MDPISHLVFGRALAAVTPRPTTGPPRGLTAAIVIGSIAPDIDALLMPFGWDRYLLWHQRGTHALSGTIVDAILLAAVLHLALRATRRGRRDPDAVSAATTTAAAVAAPAPDVASDAPVPVARFDTPPAASATVARLHHLALAAWIGCLGHALLDLVSGGTIRLFAPFSTVPFGVPWTAMADPLLAGPLVLFFLATLVWRRHTRRLAVATLVALAAVIGVKEVSRRMAVDAYARATTATAVTAPTDAMAPRDTMDATGATGAMNAGGPPPESSALEAAWGSFTRWWAFDRAGTRLRTWEIDAWSGAARLYSSRNTGVGVSAGHTADDDGSLIEASRRLDTVRHLHQLFDLTFVEVRRHERETDVRWADIRFCDAADCALWFGGTFDSSGRALQQFVLVGTLHQSRAP